MSYYPTQEDELRAKEAQAESIKQSEEAKFLSTFQTIPARNVGRLSELAKAIVSNFNRIMEGARQEPYQRQEDIMAGMKKDQCDRSATHLYGKDKPVDCLKRRKKGLAAVVFCPRLISELTCCALLRFKFDVTIIQKLAVEVA